MKRSVQDGGNMTTKKNTPARNKTGRFLKGQSGNPGGRPKGSKNNSTMVKQAIEGQLVGELADNASDILAKAISLAKQGDPAMIKLLLDKLLPSARSDNLNIEKGSKGINIIIKGMEPEIFESKTIKGKVIDSG
jgi:hypothetical protein